MGKPPIVERLRAETSLALVDELRARGSKVNGYGTLHSHDRCLINETAEALNDLVEASKDALAGWRYIRLVHGDLYGVGWDRVEKALTDALAKAGQP